MSYCAELVRNHDRDRFLLGMTAAPARRDALWPLFAFNYEIAKTREVVSEPTLGLIRLQWWRDAIAALYAGNVMQHEILTALAPVVRECNLPRARFDELINAREADVEGKPLESFDALKNYADATCTPLNRLVLKALAQDDAKVHEVSMAYALTGLLRAAPYKNNFLPHGVTAGQVADAARANLDAAQPLSGYLKASAALTGLYLIRLKKASYDAADRRLHAPPLAFAVRALAGGFR
jgi:phytoene/squalene synthetase